MPVPNKQPAPAARLRDVSMYFRDFSVCALNAISLEVGRGEIFGLVGPAGAGKSTALKILAGRLRPTYGSIKVFGRSPWRARTMALAGYVAAKPGDGRESDAGGLSRFVKKFLPRSHPASLAQVLAKKPALVILDEPFSGLDAASCRDMKALLLSLRREGRTVVFSGDSLIEAKDICDRVALCYGGKVEAVGTIQELLASPQAVRFTAPVIPQATLDRVLKIIREDLGGVDGLAGDKNTQPPAAAQRKADTIPAASITNKILMPLVKNAPGSDATEPKNG
jgi:ABC-2 type transport system ATP-binding protein